MKRAILKIGLMSALMGFLGLSSVYAQKKNDFGNPQLTHYLNDKKTRFISLSGYVEFWARYTNLNPGSIENEQLKSSLSDLSLRRVRIKLTYKPTEKLMFVLQGGPTNVNPNAKTNTYIDLLDAYTQYDFSKAFTIGGGRSTWRGLSRFSTGPLNTLLYDLPAYATANAGATDMVVRELGIFAKGQIGKFDYRVVLANPYTAATADPKLNVANFSKNAPGKDFSGYFRYAFLDTEENTTPFNSGTYGGNKRVLSVGAGFEYIDNALWHADDSKNVIHDDMKRFAVDAIYDAPLNKEKGTSVSAYGMAMYNDFGPNYVKYVGTNNPATGVDPTLASLNGAGNAMPVMGTGNVYYAQVGGTLPYFSQEKKTLQLQPAVSVQYNDFDGLHQNSAIYDAGVSLLMNKMSSRLTFDAQNRPIYQNDANSNAVVTDHKWQFILKYRIDFN